VPSIGPRLLPREAPPSPLSTPSSTARTWPHPCPHPLLQIEVLAPSASHPGGLGVVREHITAIVQDARSSHTSGTARGQRGGTGGGPDDPSVRSSRILRGRAGPPRPDAAAPRSSGPVDNSRHPIEAVTGQPPQGSLGHARRWPSPEGYAASYGVPKRDLVRDRMSEHIFHLVPAAEWRRGLDPCAAPDEEGFVHCSTVGQLARVADMLFAGRRDLILLEIDQRSIRRGSPPGWSERISSLRRGRGLPPTSTGPSHRWRSSQRRPTSRTPTDGSPHRTATHRGEGTRAAGSLSLAAGNPPAPTAAPRRIRGRTGLIRSGTGRRGIRPGLPTCPCSPAPPVAVTRRAARLAPAPPPRHLRSRAPPRAPAVAGGDAGIPDRRVEVVGARPAGLATAAFPRLGLAAAVLTVTPEGR